MGGERISIPADALINIEHERGETDEEIEFQVKWSRKGAAEVSAEGAQGEIPGP